VPPHLRRRSRGCENACYHAAKENEFSPVHSVIAFKKLNPSGFEKYRRSRIGGNAVVTFGAPFSGANVNALPFELALVLVRFYHILDKLMDIVRVKYWEIIADNLNKAGWSWGCMSAVDSSGRTIFVADAHRGDGKRFVVRADEKLTAFVEIESAIRAVTS
jgi:hypothetical protein